jgi:hypothetical protein
MIHPQFDTDFHCILFALPAAATTHIGHNLGRTDLWVIAIEPK